MAKNKKRRKGKTLKRSCANRKAGGLRGNEKAGWIELTEDVNCIPAGIYRLDEIIDGEMYACSIGTQVSFALRGFPSGALRSLPKKPSREMRTSIESFARRYFALLDQADREAPFDPSEPLTIAFIDPALEAYREAPSADCSGQIH